MSTSDKARYVAQAREALESVLTLMAPPTCPEAALESLIRAVEALVRTVEELERMAHPPVNFEADVGRLIAKALRRHEFAGVRAEEREACAKLCREIAARGDGGSDRNHDLAPGAEACAEAIEGRGA